MQHLIRINSILLLMILSLSLKSQTTSWTLKCILESKLQHSSGILTLNEGQTFWTQVDNSSPAELYEIDLNCKILRTVKIIGVSKTDWEEITTDDQGNIYLGDFGNNNNSRQDLKIYILHDLANHLNDSIRPELIQFNYNNQTAFLRLRPTAILIWKPWFGIRIRCIYFQKQNRSIYRLYLPI